MLTWCVACEKECDLYASVSRIRGRFSIMLIDNPDCSYAHHSIAKLCVAIPYVWPRISWFLLLVSSSHMEQLTAALLHSEALAFDALVPWGSKLISSKCVRRYSWLFHRVCLSTRLVSPISLLSHRRSSHCHFCLGKWWNEPERCMVSLVDLRCQYSYISLLHFPHQIMHPYTTVFFHHLQPLRSHSRICQSASSTSPKQPQPWSTSKE